MRTNIPNITEFAALINLEGPSMLQKVIRGERNLSFSRAVELEIVSNGQIRFEDMVKPEVAQAFTRLIMFRNRFDK